MRSAGTGNAGCLELDLEPQIHMMEDLSSENSRNNITNPAMTEGKRCNLDPW